MLICSDKTILVLYLVNKNNEDYSYEIFEL